jgi:fucose permease
VGFLVDAGVDWQPILIGTALIAIPLAVLFSVVEMPGGRRDRRARPSDRADAAGGKPTSRFAAPIVLLGVAISCYVASEVGVSSWLVRFLEPAPLAQATTALSLFWAGLAVGRLVSAQLADRFDHLAFATVSAAAVGVALIGAIFVPSLPVSIALFAITGFASGPVFPMIVAIGGERYPDRSAAVSGFLTGAAVVGSVIYPPVMGFLSVTVGLTVAMFGNVVLALACAGALLLVGRSRRGDNVPA